MYEKALWFYDRISRGEIMGELESKYSTYVDGEYTNVLPFDELIRGIKAHIQSVEMRNKYLENENKKLKDEHYKDEELEKLRSELKQCRENLNRGFGISEEENAAIEKWKLNHEIDKHGLDTEEKRFASQGCCGGKYVFEFIPTTVSIVGRIKCGICGENSHSNAYINT